MPLTLPRISASEVSAKAKAFEFTSTLIAVTLTSGRLLVGGIMPLTFFDREDAVYLRYNTAEGKTYGNSIVIEIPYDVIAYIEEIPLSEKSKPVPNVDTETIALYILRGMSSLLPSHVAVWNYPNPLAAEIFHTNETSLELHPLRFFHYSEKALRDEAIPPDGIDFRQDILLYADWEYFEHTSRGETSITGSLIGIAEITKSVQPSPHETAYASIRKNISWQKRSNNEHHVKGCILIENQPQDTLIQGEKSIVVMCAKTNTSSSDNIMPIIVKLRFLSYPFEFLSRIASPLSFYGELLPIPIALWSGNYSKALLARAIGYISD